MATCIFAVIAGQLVCYLYGDCVWIQILGDVLPFPSSDRIHIFPFADLQSVLSVAMLEFAVAGYAADVFLVEVDSCVF